MSGSVGSLHLVANARMPSQRAQSLQVAQAASSYARAGAQTTLWYARRRDTPLPGKAAELWDHYAVPPGSRPDARAVGCLDWIDLVPRSLQFVPARLQESSFAWNATRQLRALPATDHVLTREVEIAAWLRGRPRAALELHRLPGGRLRRRWLRAAAEGPTRFVAISGGVRDDLVEGGVQPERVLVAHDGFQPERFAGVPDREAACRELGLDPGRPVVVYTGGLLAWKGVDVLVDAARDLRSVQVVIAGGMDADVERLRGRASGLEHVRIDGFQPPARVPLYLAAADLGVVPNRAAPAISARYTSPLKVFEAMALGLPLVVSDLPSLRDVLDETQALFVAPEDPAALRAGIQALLDDPDRRGALSAALRAASPEHTWDSRARRVLDFLGAAA